MLRPVLLVLAVTLLPGCSRSAAAPPALARAQVPPAAPMEFQAKLERLVATFGAEHPGVAVYDLREGWTASLVQMGVRREKAHSHPQVKVPPEELSMHLGSHRAAKVGDYLAGFFFALVFFMCPSQQAPTSPSGTAPPVDSTPPAGIRTGRDGTERGNDPV